MTDDEASTGIETLKEYVIDLGDEVFSEETLETDNGEVDLLLCLHGDNLYSILENPDHPFFRIRYRFSFIEQIAARLSETDIEERTGESPDEDGDFRTLTSGPDKETIESAEELEGDIIIAQEGDELPPAAVAAQDIIESMDEDVLERFGLNLFQELSHPEVATQLTYTSDNYFQGFRIDRKIFPEDSGFSLTEFNNSVQAVISMGAFGSNWIGQLLESELGDLEDLDMSQEK